MKMTDKPAEYLLRDIGVRMTELDPTPKSPADRTTGADTRQIGGDHYLNMGVEPWKALEDWLTLTEFVGYLRGTTIAYLARAGRKDTSRTLLEDLSKAHHCLEKLLEVLKNAESPDADRS